MSDRKNVKYNPLPDCKFCGGIHFGTPRNICPFQCPNCKQDMREGHPQNELGAVMPCQPQPGKD